MMKKLILILIAEVLLIGCATNRILDPNGAYNGDRILYDFDGILLNYSDITEKLLEVAARNPGAIAESESMSSFVAELKANRKSVLSRAKAARSNYIVTRTAMGSLTDVQAIMEFAIEAARTHLITLATQADNSKIELREAA